jgi:hypothetical protein
MHRLRAGEFNRLLDPNEFYVSVSYISLSTSFDGATDLLSGEIASNYESRVPSPLAVATFSASMRVFQVFSSSSGLFGNASTDFGNSTLSIHASEVVTHPIVIVLDRTVEIVSARMLFFLSGV